MCRQTLAMHTNTHLLTVSSVCGRPGESVQNHIGGCVLPWHPEAVCWDVTALQIQRVGDGLFTHTHTLVVRWNNRLNSLCFYLLYLIATDSMTRNISVYLWWSCQSRPQLVPRRRWRRHPRCTPSARSGFSAARLSRGRRPPADRGTGDMC